MAIAEEKMRRGVVPYVNHQFYTPPPAVPGSAVGPTNYQPNFTMGTNPAPAAPAPGAVDVRAKYNPANGSPEAKAWMASQQPAAPQAPSAPAAPAPQAAAPAQPKGPGAINRMNTAFTGMTGMGGEPSRAMGAVGRTGATVMKAAGRLAAPLGVINEAVDVGKVAVDPNASGIDVATQASQGAARLASAGVGAAAGAAAGSVIPVVGTAIGGIAGGLLGYYGANKAIEAGRSAVGVDPRSPAERAPSLVTPSPVANAAPVVPPAATAPAVVPAAPGAVPAQPVVNPTQEAAAPASGAIRRDGNSYSGTNVSGPVTFTDGAGQPVAARGGYASLDTSQGYAQDLKELAAGAGGSSPALTAARDAAIKRGDIDAVRASYGGNFMGKTAADAPIDALMNNGRPMTAKKAAAIAQLQAQKDGTIQAGATRKLVQDKFALEATGVNLDNQGKKQIQDAQTKLANAKTAAERLSATDTLRALQGKYEKEMPNRFTVVPGGQAVDPATQQLVREPSQVLDNQSGQFINAAPPKPAQNFTKGQTYTDAKGNKAVWDGQQFVAAK